MKEQITVFAPASVANVGCGYDVLGFALEGLGDQVQIQKKEEPGLEIGEIDGNGDIPKDPAKNVATVAARALLDSYGNMENGFLFKIRKMVSPGSGLGSSASSSAAAVFGINELIGRPFSKLDLVKFAGEGEKAASGKIHFDNVAASIFGGFTLVRSMDPLDVIELPFPDQLYVVIAHPEIEIKTADARKILREDISLTNAITQWANLSGFTVGLLKADYDLISRSMKDVIAEPTRSILIPQYHEAKQAAMNAGSLGCNIAGSGPSIFSLCKDVSTAEKVLSSLKSVYSETSLEVSFHLSKINPQGTTLVTQVS